jgi:hypothetical protein
MRCVISKDPKLVTLYHQPCDTFLPSAVDHVPVVRLFFESDLYTRIARDEDLDGLPYVLDTVLHIRNYELTGELSTRAILSPGIVLGPASCGRSIVRFQARH